MSKLSHAQRRMLLAMAENDGTLEVNESGAHAASGRVLVLKGLVWWAAKRRRWSLTAAGRAHVETLRERRIGLGEVSIADEMREVRSPVIYSGNEPLFSPHVGVGECPDGVPNGRYVATLVLKPVEVDGERDE